MRNVEYTLTDEQLQEIKDTIKNAISEEEGAVIHKGYNGFELEIEVNVECEYRDHSYSPWYYEGYNDYSEVCNRIVSLGEVFVNHDQLNCGIILDTDQEEELQVYCKSLS